MNNKVDGVTAVTEWGRTICQCLEMTNGANAANTQTHACRNHNSRDTTTFAGGCLCVLGRVPGRVAQLQPRKVYHLIHNDKQSNKTALIA